MRVRRRFQRCSRAPVATSCPSLQTGGGSFLRTLHNRHFPRTLPYTHTHTCQGACNLMYVHADQKQQATRICVDNDLNCSRTGTFRARANDIGRGVAVMVQKKTRADNARQAGYADTHTHTQTRARLFEERAISQLLNRQLTHKAKTNTVAGRQQFAHYQNIRVNANISLSKQTRARASYSRFWVDPHTRIRPPQCGRLGLFITHAHKHTHTLCSETCISLFRVGRSHRSTHTHTNT